MATHSSILAWRIPWLEEPGGLESTGSQRVGHDCSDLVHMHTHVISDQGSNTTKLKLIGFAFIFNLKNMKTRVWGKIVPQASSRKFLFSLWMSDSELKMKCSDINVPKEAAQRGQRNKGFPLNVRAQMFSFSTKATKSFPSSKRRKPPEESLMWCSRTFCLLAVRTQDNWPWLR